MSSRSDSALPLTPPEMLDFFLFFVCLPSFVSFVSFALQLSCIVLDFVFSLSLLILYHFV